MHSDFKNLPVWLRMLPKTLRNRIAHRIKLQRALTNTGWLLAEKVLRGGVGLLVWVWLARYLGPEQFGMFNYALAFVSLFSAISVLGLKDIVVRDLVREPDAAGITLGTAFFLRLAGGFLALGAAVSVLGLVRPGDSMIALMVATLGTIFLFKSTEVVKYWFESRVQSKYAVWIENTALLIFAMLKILLILAGASVMAFVWILLAEAVIVSAGLLAVYVWQGNPLHCWKVRIRRAQKLLNDSWPLILSGLAVMVYMRVDQVMLGQMIGDDAVGVYAAAVRISEAWYFIPMAFLASVFPAVIEAKKQGEEIYFHLLQRLYDLMVLIALLAAILITVFSKWGVLLLFGQDYAQASTVLAIHIWAGVFVILGVTSNKYLIIENLFMLSLYRTLSGLVVNILLNLLLIPRWGISGAAVATLVSYMTATFIVYIFKPARMHCMQMLKALLLFSVPGKVKRMVQS